MLLLSYGHVSNNTEPVVINFFGIQIWNITIVLGGT